MLAGDSHANWVSDLVWVGDAQYNQQTGAGSVGVEFAGTAVSSGGYASNISQGNAQALSLIQDNSELQWTDGWYRGYFELQVYKNRTDAHYYGCPTVAQRVPYEIPLANFSVASGENHLTRPVGGGVAVDGALKDGRLTNSTTAYNTANGEWVVTDYDVMYIEYPDADE